jgi:hypothetical protein
MRSRLLWLIVGYIVLHLAFGDAANIIDFLLLLCSFLSLLKPDLWVWKSLLPTREQAGIALCVILVLVVIR